MMRQVAGVQSSFIVVACTQTDELLTYALTVGFTNVDSGNLSILSKCLYDVEMV